MLGKVRRVNLATVNRVLAKESLIENRTFEQRSKEDKEVNHAGIWEKNIPDKERMKEKVEIFPVNQGTAESSVSRTV